jgi:ArsR family transcriptional regulator, arsenate/arsenite/antimonite-responsive transcriptional repressor / arsenate reductase (thioredoxin)
VQSSSVSERAAGTPPSVVRLLAHPLRWRLLQELAASDRRVGELTGLVNEPQSLVSYHMARLRSGELVRTRRSSADRRDSYYTLDLTRCREQLEAAGDAVHPGLRLVPAPPWTPRTSDRRRHRIRVLFLCTGNSARSQIAEALLVRMSQGSIDAASAGSDPKPLHPNAVRVMAKRGIDISASRTKHLDEFVTQRFDAVITLCDKVREVCPEFPSHPRLVHWSIADPALEGPTDRASHQAFERTATELETRVGFLLDQLDHLSTRRFNRVER